MFFTHLRFPALTGVIGAFWRFSDSLGSSEFRRHSLPCHATSRSAQLWCFLRRPVLTGVVGTFWRVGLLVLCGGCLVSGADTLAFFVVFRPSVLGTGKRVGAAEEEQEGGRGEAEETSLFSSLSSTYLPIWLWQVFVSGFRDTFIHLSAEQDKEKRFWQETYILYSMILGPLWTGGFLDNLYILYGVNLFLCLLIMSLLVLSYR